MSNKLPPDFIELHKKNNSKDEMVEVVEDILSKVKSGEIENFILSGFTNENEIITAKANITTLVEEQTLVAALQTMVMMDVVEYMGS